MSHIETTQLGPLTVPRIFNGLWQLSSPAWGTAPVSKVRQGMKRYVDAGFSAFDMVSLTFAFPFHRLIKPRVCFLPITPTASKVEATVADHYGSAEQIFGSFLENVSCEDRSRIICATKWCIFLPTNPTPQFVRTGVEERLIRTGTKTLDLLQLHWSDYSSRAYITALQHLHALQKAPHKLIRAIGLCNFDSVRTDEICSTLGPGVIVSNQVQFSLVDTRPLYGGMAEVCQRHNIKLLTYGTLCGGFLSDKYLGAPLPDPYKDAMTPSQRKYLDVIVRVWGDWPLFQKLLRALRAIGDKYEGRSISVIATRWVLDHACVASVIVGTRLGLSEHIDDNRRVFGFRLSPDDNAAIQKVLALTGSRGLVASMGDCGAEYR